MIYNIIFIIISSYCIWKASSSFDIASSFLTRNIGEGIKGPTINAIASSLPELLISFFFLFHLKDIEGFSAGYATIIGSSIFNIAMIPTISFLVIYFKSGEKILPTDKNIISQDGLFLILTEIALILGLYYGGISISLSIILIVIYLIYILIIFKKRNIISKNQNEKLTKENKNLLRQKSFFINLIQLDIANIFIRRNKINTRNSLLILTISLIIISIACRQLVISSEHISNHLNLNLFFITFFIAAISSSVPDTILSIKDAENKKYKDAFSNAYGSNIFDICIGIGLPVLIYLTINDINIISSVKNDSNNIVLISSLLLIIFSIPITLIYWLKSLNLFRSLIIIILYITFLTLVFFLSS